MNQLWQLSESAAHPAPLLPPPASPSTYKTALVTGQSWQCTSLCQACLPSLFTADRLSDGLQTGYWNSLHVSPFSDYCRCTEVQFSVTHREESFLSVFPYLSNTRTLLGGEKGLRGFLNTLRQFIEDHEAHYSETPDLSFTMHTSNASLYICK